MLRRRQSGSLGTQNAYALRNQGGFSMTRATRLLLTLSLGFVLVASAPFLVADDPKTHTQTESQQEPSVVGELKSIDANAKTLVVTTSEGSDMEFLYTESTQIEGAQGSVEGLAGSAGSKVKVFYKTEEGKNTATRIKVKDAQKDS